MDVEALVEAPFVKNGENGHASPLSERFNTPPTLDSAAKPLSRVETSKSHHRSITPTSEHSRHSSYHRKDHDRHRDDYRRDDSRHRRDRDREYRSDSRSRRDERYYDDRDRYESRRSEDRYRDRDDRYRDDRSDRRRSRHDDYDDERSSKRRREYDDRERSRPVDDRYREKSSHVEDIPVVRYTGSSYDVDCRDPSPMLTEDERDERTIFVQQLASRLRTKELIKFFEQIGPVREAQIVKDRVTGRSKGYVSPSILFFFS
jgi:RNA-binding protein 23/39